MRTGKILYRVCCDHPDCTQVMGGDEHEWWTFRSLIPLADDNGWMFGPETGVAYCPDHASERPMTEPLIGRDALAALADEVAKQIELGNPYVTYADATMSYLRRVLTPEALDDLGPGIDLYHRIFGEDK